MMSLHTKVRSTSTVPKLLQLLTAFFGFVLLLAACDQPLFRMHLSSHNTTSAFTMNLTYTSDVSVWRHKEYSCAATSSFNPPDALYVLNTMNAERNLNITNFTAAGIEGGLCNAVTTRPFHGYTDKNHCPGLFSNRFNTIAVLLVLAVVFALFGLGVSAASFFDLVLQKLPEHLATGLLGSAFISAMLSWSLMIGAYTVKCLELRLSDKYSATVASSGGSTTRMESASSAYGAMMPVTAVASAFLLVALVATVLTATKKQRSEESEGSYATH